MSITLTDNTGDLNGLSINTDHEAKVSLNQTANKSGFVSLVSEKGILPSGTRMMKEVEASEDYRLRVGIDSLWFTDQAVGTTINTSIWTSPIGTMTVTLAQNAYILNGGNSVTAGHYALHKTWRTFPMAYKGSSVYCECTMLYTAQPTTNHSIEGGFMAVASSVADPTDGVFFRVRDGNLYCVCCNNSVEQSVNLGTAPIFGVEHNLVIEVTPTTAIFWMDESPVAKFVNAASTFSIQAQAQLPFVVRQFNGGTAPAYALQSKFSNISVSMADLDNNRLWPTCKAGMGGGSYQAPSGAAAVQTAAYANGAAPATRAVSQTTKMETALGGMTAFAAYAGSELDQNLFGYQVPAGNTLIVRGLRIETANLGAVVTTTGTLLQWSLGIGSTADTLAGTESATVKIRRVIPLGYQTFPVSAPIGAITVPIDVNLDAPIVIHGGEWLQIIFRQPVGSATASEVYRVLAMINGYFE